MRIAYSVGQRNILHKYRPLYTEDMKLALPGYILLQTRYIIYERKLLSRQFARMLNC